VGVPETVHLHRSLFCLCIHESTWNIVGFPSQLQVALIVSTACATNAICRSETGLLQAAYLLGLFYDPEGAGSTLLRNVGVIFYETARRNIPDDDAPHSLTSLLQTVAPQFLIMSARVARVANQLLMSFNRWKEAGRQFVRNICKETNLRELMSLRRISSEFKRLPLLEV
jgi:hypothetical protein